jgi:hypothetical protein
MTSARADSWHESGVRAQRPAASARPSRQTPPPPLPPLPELPGRSRASRPAAPAERSRDDRLRADLQRSRPPGPRRTADPARDPRATGRSRRPDVDERPAPREPGRAGTRRPPEAPRPTAATGGGRLRGVVAVLGVFLATLAGGAVDSFFGMGLGMVTLVALVASTAVATLGVRRRDMLSVVLCPPLVFVAVAGVNIALAPSATLSLPTVATLLIRGFPTMAAATAAALVLALVRLGTRR